MNTWKCTECRQDIPDDQDGYPVDDDARDVCQSCYDGLAETGKINAGYDVTAYATLTDDARKTLEKDAHDTGWSRGWDHANYVTAYGGDMDAEPEVPERFAAVATYYAAAYAEGVRNYQSEEADAEEELGLINSTPGNVNGEMARWYDGAETDQREAWADFVEYAGADYVETITPDQFESEIYQGQHASM
jgi:hypothetical protein